MKCEILCLKFGWIRYPCATLMDNIWSKGFNTPYLDGRIWFNQHNQEQQACTFKLAHAGDGAVHNSQLDVAPDWAVWWRGEAESEASVYLHLPLAAVIMTESEHGALREASMFYSCMNLTYHKHTHHIHTQSHFHTPFQCSHFLFTLFHSQYLHVLSQKHVVV